MAPLEINPVVLGAIDLLRDGLGARIALRTKKATGLPPVNADAIGLEIVIKNIVLNAIESIPFEGQILVSTRLGKNQTVIVSIQDTGQGIQKQNLDKIFDSFYTTKRSTGGTGLGLKICAEIIRKHQGTIIVKSKVGKGITVTLYLPASEMTERSIKGTIK